MGTTKTHGSVFSGIGGAELAAKWMGWSNVFHCEINPFCRRILRYWFTESKSYEDITKTDFSQWNGKVDVLTGGFPCQPFSSIGKRRGKETTVISGRRCYGLYVKYGHVGSFVKTLLEFLRCYSPGLGLKWEAKTIYSKRITYYVQNKDTRLTKYARILRTRDILSSRLLFRLVPSVRRIDGIGYGLLQGKLLPTPTASCCKQSFVCGGDDGIPERLDGVSVSKWIEESTKSLGNAWVPKVAYEIFRVIELTEQNEKTQ